MLACISPMAPQEDDLLQYVLDAVPLSQKGRGHMAQCTTCQQRLALYQNLQVSLTARLYRCQCPSPTRLNFYCVHTLSADEAMSIVRHLDYCPLCVNEVRAIRRILADFVSFPETRS